MGKGPHIPGVVRESQDLVILVDHVPQLKADHRLATVVVEQNQIADVSQNEPDRNRSTLKNPDLRGL
jgi:hypothetical protein